MLRIALAQIDPLVGDIDGNVVRILDAWRRAHDAGADVVAFPELATSGYPPEDLLFKPEFVAANRRALDRLVEEGPPGTAAVIGFVRYDPSEGDEDEWDVTVTAREDLHNSAVLIAGGEVVGVYDKQRLPNYGVFDEARYFTPGDGTPLVVNVAGVPLGVTICEDLWTRAGPVSEAAHVGAEVVLNLNASPYHRGKRADRERWCRHHATTDGVWLAYVNTVGAQDELVFDGDSTVTSPQGEVVARGAQFALDLVLTEIEVAGPPLPAVADVAGFGGDRPALEQRPLPEPADGVAEVWRALVLGTRDYCRKNGFAKAVIGLSGGIDSSVTAAIAVAALGADQVVGVAMPSPHSTQHSLDDAEALAKNLGIDYRVLPIARGMDAFDEILEPLFAGTELGVAEENIQARIRGIILMAISNKFGHIVLATGNKSEMAVGYATLYGDMVGGFALLKDCHKQLVYDLAHHANRDREVIPDNVLTKPPSAELRPGQRDQDTLPPYDVLDPILCLYVEEDRSIAEIVEHGYDEATVREVVRLVDRAEYKRRQAPPGVKITERAFGKDRRVPITNGWRP